MRVEQAIDAAASSQALRGPDSPPQPQLARLFRSTRSSSECIQVSLWEVRGELCVTKSLHAPPGQVQHLVRRCFSQGHAPRTPGGLELLGRFVRSIGLPARLRAALSRVGVEGGDYGGTRLALVVLGLLVAGARRLEHLRFVSHDLLFRRFCGLRRAPAKRQTTPQGRTACRSAASAECDLHTPFENLSTVSFDKSHHLLQVAHRDHEHRHGPLRDRRVGKCCHPAIEPLGACPTLALGAMTIATGVVGVVQQSCLAPRADLWRARTEWE